MLMANGVEGRFPFLDPHVAEFAARLPERLRLRGIDEKYLLRRAVRGLVPADVGARPKRPYRAPILEAFFGPDAPEYVRDLLDASRVGAGGLFDPEAVARLAEKCRRYVDVGLAEGDEMALVGVLSTQLLEEQLVTNPALAAPATPTRVVVGDRVVGGSPEDGAHAPEERTWTLKA